MTTGTEGAAVAPETIVATPTSTDDVKPVSAETKTDESAPPAETADGSNPEEAPKPEKVKDGFQKKIDKLTARAKAAEARAEQLASELTTRFTPQPQQQMPDKAPKLDDFPSYDAYEAAKDTWLIDQAARKFRQDQEITERNRQSQTEADRKREAGTRFRAEVEAMADRYDGLDDAVEAFHTGGVPVSVPMLEYVYELADDGNKVALVHHLYGNQELAEKIAKLSPTAAAREMAKIEASLAKISPRTTSTAPPPPKIPKAGAESPPANLETMSMSEYAAHRRKQEAAAHARRFK